ncbi:MAG: tRNA (cytidine(34)-2'-O)-methyltransferase [Pseudomonadota bacterium]
MRLALYQPDIPQNTGTILRMAACLNIRVELIGPAGFDMSDRAFRRAGLDYLEHVSIRRHVGWDAFSSAWHNESDGGRLVLLTTKGSQSHLEFAFKPADCLLLGRESAGVPDSVHDCCDARVRIPMARELRSLNVAVCAAIVAGEALRQTDGFA